MKPQNGHRSVAILLGLLLLTGYNLLTAQPVGTPLVLNFDMHQYRAENQNWSVETREDGLVFFGNNSGLLYTDGLHWKLKALPGSITVRSVAVTPDQRIYAGGFQEFGYFKADETGELTYFSLSNLFDNQQLHNDEFWRILPLDNKVYFQSFSSIFCYDGHETIPLELPGSVVLLQKVRERLFIDVIDLGLHELRNDSLVLLPGMDPLQGDEVKLVLPFGEEQLLIGAAKKGLFLYDGTRAVPWEISIAGEIRNAEINNGVFLDGNYFIGTIVEGLYALNTEGKLLYHLHAGNVLQNNTVLSMAADSSRNIWLGLDRGIGHVIRNDVLGYYLDLSGELGTVFDAAWYRGYLWLGTNLGLIRMQSDDQRSFKNPELIEGSQGQVWDLLIVDDELLVGHNSGTYRVEGDRLKELSPVNGGFDMQLYDNGNEQVIIQSSYSSINIYRRGPEGWQFSGSVKGILEPFSKFEIDPYGNIWAAHLHRNIFRIKLNEALDSIISIRTYGTAQGFPSEKNISVSKIENRVVFPTREAIYTYDDLIDTIIPYERLNNALGPFSKAAHIIPGHNSKYWFIRDQQIGSYRISGSDIDSIFAYNLAMQGIQLGRTFPRIVNIDEEKALICLDKGFAIYTEPPGKGNTLPEKTFLREVLSEGSRPPEKLPLVPGTNPVNIPYAGRDLSFSFSTLPHYKTPLYRYMLKGLDRNWTEWTVQSSVEYDRLPAGKYTFSVQACNIHMQPGPVTSYPLMIHPPWYFSALALVIYGILFTALIIVIRLSFLRRLSLHARRIEQKELYEAREKQSRTEQEYIRVKNELLQKDLDNKNNQLADYTMNVIRKNEVLMKVREVLEHQKKELGDRYPNYLYERIMNLLDTSISSEDEWKVFEYHFDQTHENFFRRLKKQYPELTPGDLKLCAYLRMNLSSKELAPLLNINHKSVEVHRSRLRKKLRLSGEDNLVEFLLEF
ncbi:MAG: triple tyrosine motif-containing protein [Bacteroidales bacterium]|nr:triple tyrosine motif-containing protein [Bacteroidales bacterium]MDT8432597.1 triple tyrosine motif-containing protein [Bacteroidales bacterium]